jgi:hypothetical protein
MTDETTPQDGKAMSPASAGSASEGSLAAYLKRPIFRRKRISGVGKC